MPLTGWGGSLIECTLLITWWGEKLKKRIKKKKESVDSLSYGAMTQEVSGIFCLSWNNEVHNVLDNQQGSLGEKTQSRTSARYTNTPIIIKSYNSLWAYYVPDINNRCFTCIGSMSPPNNPMKWILILSPFDRSENRCLERSEQLSNITAMK